MVNFATLFVVTIVINIKLVRFCDTDDNILRSLCHSLVSVGKNFGRTIQLNSPDLPIEIAYQWEWRENDGSFVPFDPDQNTQIEIAFVKNQHKGKITVTGDRNQVKNNFKYEVDFDSRTELNTQYLTNPRPIRRICKVPTGFYWELLNGNVWKPAVDDFNKQIEQTYIAGNFREELDLRLTDGRQVRARRRDDTYEEKLLQQLAKKSTAQPSDNDTKISDQKATMKALLIGFKEDLHKGIPQFDKKLESFVVKETVEFDKDITAPQLEEVRGICAKFGVEFQPKGKKIELHGVEKPVMQASKAIMQMVYSSAAATFNR